MDVWEGACQVEGKAKVEALRVGGENENEPWKEQHRGHG